MDWPSAFISRRVFGISLLLCSIVFCSFLAKPGLATEDLSPWLSSSPSVKNLKENIDFSEVPLYVDGNQECVVQKKFITRPAKKIPFQSEQSYQSCGVDTRFGTVDKTYKLTRLGTNIAGDIYYPSGAKVKLSPLPHSDDALSLDFNAPSGAYMTIERGISLRLATKQINSSSGEIKHILNNGTLQTVKDELQNKLYGRLDARGVSGNGRWVAFDAVGKGLVRLDVDTGDVLFFAPGYSYGNGQDPLLEYALSDDGRYVAVSAFLSSSNTSFRLYDLSTCIKSATPNKPANCQYRDLKQVLQADMPGHLGLGTKISFTDNYNLKIYGTKLKNGVRTRYIQLLTAAGHEPVRFPYLAMGDSFASGEGAFDYKPGTDVRDPKNKCHISLNSYPYLLGKELGLNNFQSIACSGAKIKDINFDFNDDQNRSLRKLYNDSFRQAEGMKDDSLNNSVLDGFLPGYRTQYQFVQKYQPDKITISISGNDMGFGNIVKTCVTWPDTCYSKPSERAAIAKTVNDRFPELVNMYNQLKETSPGSDIYVIGYPRMVNPGGSCELNVRANRDELIFFNQLADYIDSVIKKAADNAGVYYVDDSDALNGHRLCEADAADLAVNGITLGNDSFFDIGPFGNESYHPNALGHELLEKAVLEKTDNFNAHNPAAQTVAPPTMEDARSFIQSGDFDYMDTYMFVQQELLDVWWHTGAGQTIEADGFDPLSTVQAYLTSDPVALGSLPVSSSGTVDGTLVMPESVPPGYHTLHLTGKNVAGENIEYQQLVFVYSSNEDYDGDGIANSKDPCLFIDPSGIDYDEDGIDDGCDGSIGNPPISTAPEDSSGADIISSMDSQNQNATYVQPQQSAGPQTQAATVPTTSLNSQNASQGSQMVLFGDTTSTASLLNGSQVLGSSVPQSSSKTYLPAQSLHDTSSSSVGGILIVLLVLLVVTGLLRLRNIR